MSKKIALLFLVIFLGGLFFPLVSLAGEYKADDTNVCYEGLVPCGKEVSVGGHWDKDTRKCVDGDKKLIYCQFCHFFVMLNGIFEFVLIYIVPPIAVLMLVVGGIMFYFAGGKPELVTRGKSLITNVVIGLFLAYGAFMLVGLLLGILGLAEPWDSLKDIATEGITIECDIELP